MIIMSRTPLRVSLFGGGTDYPAYFQHHPGAVIGFAISKYIYISALRLGAWVDYRYRLSYSKVETVETIGDIQHPVVRAVFDRYGIQEPLDISVQADLPASIGLGSSSAFTVGMINMVSSLGRVPRTKLELAREAIYVERVLLRENVGVQDQLHAAFGGFNRFDFNQDRISLSPIDITGSALKTLSDWMVLVFTGIKRHASPIVAEQIQATQERKLDKDLSELMVLMEEGHKALQTGSGEARAQAVGRLLNESWAIKRRLTTQISNPAIDELYQHCIALGAIGGKLCGAGGGGFLLMVVPPDRRTAFCEALDRRNCVDFTIDGVGSVIFHQAQD
ncbi:MAG: hypothetical protein P4L10_00240 [Acidobacteriaceae bacterium]|nr:hypothetical protein [Acidobacteriaceae bacterium]